MTDAAPTDQRPPFTLTPDEALTRAGVEAKAGLSADEAATRTERYGPNKFAEGEKEPPWQAFVRQYRDLMQLVLLVAGILSIWPVGQYSTGRS